MSCISRKNLPFWNATWEQCGLKWKKGTILGDIIVLLLSFLKTLNTKCLRNFFQIFQKTLIFLLCNHSLLHYFFSLILLHCTVYVVGRGQFGKICILANLIVDLSQTETAKWAPCSHFLRRNCQIQFANICSNRYSLYTSQFITAKRPK